MHHSLYTPLIVPPSTFHYPLKSFNPALFVIYEQALTTPKIELHIYLVLCSIPGALTPHSLFSALIDKLKQNNFQSRFIF